MTDFHEELQPSNDLYHGGLGLFTYNGIPKAHYNAFSLLNRLGNELLARGNGYFITKKDQDLVLILYNYEHFSKLFAKGMHFDADKNNRYAPFTNSQKAQFHLEVSHLPSSTCLIKELYINQNKGSSYDTWLSMNQPELFEPDELTFLIDQSTPGCLIHRENIVNGTLIYNTTLEPLEVKYVQIKL